MRARNRILGVLCGALALACASAPGASAVVVHTRGGQFLGVAPRPGVAPAAIPGSVAARRAEVIRTAGFPSNDLTYQGGPVLHSSDPYLIFWAPSGETISSSWQSLIERYFTDVASDSGQASNVYAVARQYTDGAGFADYHQAFNPAGQVVQDSDPYPARDSTNCGGSPLATCITDGQLQAEISSVIAANGLPSDGPTSGSEFPGGAPIYFVVLPTDVDVCFSDGSGTCATNQFCAYHSAYTDGANDVLYAAIPSVTLDNANDAKGCQWDGNPTVQEPNGSIADVALKYISHEDNETITDPLGSAWWNESTGNEDGDNCNDYQTNPGAFAPPLGGDAGSGTLYDQLIAGDQYYLQSEWSNGSANCEMRPESATINPRFSVPAGPRSAGSALSFDPSASTGTYPFSSETWNFGDGTATTFHAGRTLAAASHTYAASGDYTVTLTLVDSRGNLSTGSEEISVGASPTAAMSVAPTQLEEGSGAVSFDGTPSSDSGASITSYAWDFGDGATASGATATHTYATAGTYLVRLTVTDSLGAVDTATSTVTVLDELPVAAFSSGVPAPETGQSVSFDGSASSDPDGSITSYAWNFGDGHSGSGPTPSHTYRTAGAYTVTLTVTDSDGQTNSVSHQLTVTQAQPPRPVFDVNPAVPIPRQAIAFDGTPSTDPNGGIIAYAWDFGDGTTGTGANPSHAYLAPGTYTVHLTVVDQAGQLASVSEPVTVYAHPVATFAFSPTQPVEQTATAFTASSSIADPATRISAYAWNFGDGTTATGATPAHTYARAGTYSVTLTVTDGLGLTSSVSEVVTVGDGAPSAVASVLSGHPVKRRPVEFSGARSRDADDPIVSYLWHFGDGSSRTGKKVSHTFARAGLYRVSLTVRDSYGERATTTVTVRVSRTAGRPRR
ncbi:MAG: PKD domain-containing protein [Solirubrobacterales bacterium]|nr:PKD domain-containing protein [Solirubrobacterales bacterium]